MRLRPRQGPRARAAQRVALLAAVACPADEAAAALVRDLRAGAPRDDDGLVVEVASRSATLAGGGAAGDAARGRLLAWLVDVEGRAVPEAAVLLGLTHLDASALLRTARQEVTGDAVARRCRGWPLVSRRSGLTPDEQHAADRHLPLCTRCRSAMAEVARARRETAARAAGLVGVVAIAQVVGTGASATSGLGALIAGKAAAGAVAAVGVAVLTVGSTIAVTQQDDLGRGFGPTVPAELSRPSSAPPAAAPTCPAECRPPISPTAVPTPAQPTTPAAPEDSPASAVREVVRELVPSLPALPLAPALPLLPGLPLLPDGPLLPEGPLADRLPVVRELPLPTGPLLPLLPSAPASPAAG